MREYLDHFSVTDLGKTQAAFTHHAFGFTHRLRLRARVRCHSERCRRGEAPHSGRRSGQQMPLRMLTLLRKGRRQTGNYQNGICFRNSL